MRSRGADGISEDLVDTSSQVGDVTASWNFFEDAENGSYTAHSSSSMFAGGIYRGDAYTWDIVGGTYGNSSNDNKWDGASFRLRYTEGASGNKGTLTMTTDKGTGLGWIRFWAGNYKDDSALSAAISVYYSVDGGRQWVSVADQVAVKRGSSNTNNGMSEYAFLVNVAGSVRIKIEKADNTSAGINIDNIRLSDYRMPVSVEDALMYQPWYYTYQGGICFMSVNAPYTAYIYHVSGALLHSVEVNGADRMIPMSTGMYVVASKLGSGKLIIK